ncbi:hypothetical protein F5884DRAFT_836842 [Xylogone sp. PMI_703]|nr:hypothetical protein F5884DRAFT_836842 [Xylogone sp. PMI_703]
MTSRIIDIVPDIEADETAVVNCAVDISQDTVTYGSVPNDLKRAFAAGDIPTVDKYTEKRLLDIDPIYKNIGQRAEEAFSSVYNESDKREYQLSIAGDPSNPVGYMWCYCPDVTVSHGDSGSIVQSCAQIGIYSVNTQWLAISTKIWDDDWRAVTEDALSLILSGFIGRFMFNRLQNMVIGTAAEAAGAATGEALVAAGVISGGFWDSVASLATGFTVAVSVGAVTWFLVNFIADFVKRDYWVGINVYNWDKNNTYVVDDFYGDNAVFNGGGSFAKTKIPSPSEAIKPPSGIPIPTEENIYQYAEFILQNDGKPFEGLGAAFRVRSADQKTGFELKYLCPRSGDNRLGLTRGASSSAKEYYGESSSWAPEGCNKMETTIPISKVMVLCIATALSGRADRFYRFDIHIGMSSDSGFHHGAEGSTVEMPIRPEPELPKKLQMGDRISMPNGGYVEVIRQDIHSW